MGNVKMESSLFLFLFMISYSSIVDGQTVRRANLLHFKPYLIDVVSETMKKVEEMHWCNLKIPEFSKDVNNTYFGQNVTGDVSYTNGFVVSIQHVDIVQSTVQQVWTWNTANQIGTVDLRAQMRLHNVVLGFDVVTELNGESRRYTSTFTHPLLSYNFSILKNMRENTITVTVTGVDPRSSGRMAYAPNDIYSEILGTSFLPADTVPGVLAWGPDILQPMCLEVVTNQLKFPEACYNC